MICIHFEGQKVERGCWIELMDGLGELGLLMARTRDMLSLLMELNEPSSL